MQRTFPGPQSGYPRHDVDEREDHPNQEEAQEVRISLTEREWAAEEVGTERSRRPYVPPKAAPTPTKHREGQSLQQAFRNEGQSGSHIAPHEGVTEQGAAGRPIPANHDTNGGNAGWTAQPSHFAHPSVPANKTPHSSLSDNSSSSQTLASDPPSDRFPPNQTPSQEFASSLHQAQEEAHAEKHLIAGRTKMLKKPGAEPTPQAEGNKRKRAARDEGEESEEDAEVEDELGSGDVAAFDPTAPITKFDAKSELVEGWEDLQSGIGPFLDGFAKTAMSNTFDIILLVSHMVNTMHHDAQKDLEEGVKHIEEEERKQEIARKTIEDFKNSMAHVATVLRNFGGPPRMG